MVSIIYEWDSCDCGSDANSYTDTGVGATYSDACEAVLEDLYDDYYEDLAAHNDEITITFWDDDEMDVNVIAEGIITASGWQLEEWA